MPAERRPLRFGSLDEVMPAVERLLRGHETVGSWSLAQICRHLALVARRVVDLPASTPSDPSRWLDAEAKRQIFATERLPAGIASQPEALPPPAEGLDARAEAEGLRQAIAHFRASPGPVIPHRLLGPLTPAEWDHLQRIHMAHHLGFALPLPTDADGRAGDGPG